MVGSLHLLVPTGLTVKVLWAELEVCTVAQARDNLAAREDIPAENITRDVGLWLNDAEHLLHVSCIKAWALGKGIDAVVWTALPSRYANRLGRVPTETEAIAHLRSLSGAARGSAKEYVWRAPAQIATPYRQRIETALGWCHDGSKTDRYIR